MASNQIYGILVTIIMACLMTAMSTDMRSRTIETQALGRIFWLGMLYDCRSDSLLPGVTLWDNDTIAQDVTRIEKRSLNYKMEDSDTFSNKAKLLDISGSLKLSFLAGNIDVSGSAKYLENRKQTSLEQKISLIYKCITRSDHLDMGTLATKNIEYQYVFEKKHMTHVVVAIEYGADAIFTFEKINKDDNSSTEVSGKLNVLIKNDPDFSANGSLKLNYSNNDKEFLDSLSIIYHGDIQLNKNPLNFEEVVKIYERLNEFVGDNGVPKRVWLYPLALLNNTAAEFTQEISANLAFQVEEIFERFHKISLKCNDLRNNVIFSQSSIFSAQLELFQSLLSENLLVFQRKLQPALSAIKGGFEEERVLIDILLNLTQSPFSYENLNKWVNNFAFQIQEITNYYQFIEGIQFVQHEDFKSHVMDPKYNEILCFIVEIPIKDAQIVAMQKDLGLREHLETVDEVELDQSMTKYEIVHIFNYFFECNKKKKEKTKAFFMSELPTTSQEIKGSIYYYASGKLKSKTYENKLNMKNCMTNDLYSGPYDNIWDDDQCPNVGNFLNISSIFECLSKCNSNFDCTAFNFNANETDCVLRHCPLPVPVPLSYAAGYKGYVKNTDPHSGPYDNIWFDNQCTYVGNFMNKSLPECLSKCDSNSDCTAVNFNKNKTDCVLRDCPLPVPIPLSHEAGYKGYVINTGAKIHKQ